MQREPILDGLRIDVDATANDHERLAIGQVQVAFFVEPPDIAERRPGRVAWVLRVARRLRIMVVVEEGKVIAAAQPRRVQVLSKSIRTLVDLAVAQYRTARAMDQRRLAGIGSRVIAQVQGIIHGC